MKINENTAVDFGFGWFGNGETVKKMSLLSM